MSSLWSYDAEQDSIMLFDEWWNRVGLPSQNILYKMYDKYGYLLYVGITNNLRIRLKAHFDEKPWINEVAKVQVEWLRTREELKERESFLISDSGPIYNLAENHRLTNAVGYFTRKIMEECPESRSAVVDVMERVTKGYE